MTGDWTPSGRIRPSHWAWTTAAATILLTLVLGIVVWTSSDVAQQHPYSNVSLEMVEWGLAIGLLPAVAVWFVAWRLRRHGEEADETASAAFGFLAVLVLGLGVGAAVLRWPSPLRHRLVLESAIALTGAALLVASVWVRHIPRPWWPRSDLSG